MINAETERELAHGLASTPRSIPSAYYYDNVGSALFEVQCMQTDYYLNRIEKEIIFAYGAEILGLMDAEVLIDLGCGNAEKTRLLLSDSASDLRLNTLVLVDLNESVLSAAKRSFEDVTGDRISVNTLSGTYGEALRELGASAQRRGVLFLGSTVGNMTDSQIRDWGNQLRASLSVGDFVLIGADLKKKPEDLLLAYNDRGGVARLTNLNVLSHLNVRYDADFNLRLFEHLVLYYESENTLRSHLVSLAAQTVRLPGLGLTIELEPGEMIQTELERKFGQGELQQVLWSAGFELTGLFTDPADAYSIQLFRIAPVESVITDSSSGVVAWQSDVEITTDYHDDS